MRGLFSARARVSLMLVVAMCLLAAVPIAASAAPPRFYPDMRDATWTAHLSGDSPGMQGEAWLKKTPCGLGSFLQLKAPSVAGMATEEHLVLREEGEADVLLAVVGADMPDFGIVIAYWPTGTPMFPDEPSDLYVQFEANKTFGAALPYPYETSDPAFMTAEEYFELLGSGSVWVDVVVEGEVVLSGRIAN